MCCTAHPALPRCSVLGVIVVGHLVRKSGRTSVVVFSLSIVMITGLGCIVGFGVPSAISDFASGAAGMGSIC